MAKRDKSSIVTADIYSNRYYRYRYDSFTQLKKIKLSRNDTLITYIANKDLIIEPIELSSNIPPQSVKNVIIDKVYDELRFDPAVEYDVTPIKTTLQSNRVKYQTLIVAKNDLEKLFEPLQKRVKVIDYVIAAPLLYKSLYQNRVIESSGSDMFIYFGDYDSFITFYHKGEYLYSKSIKFSLQNMYDRFCQLAQEVPMSKEEFRKFVANDGLKSSDDSKRELLVRVMNECFLTINDIVIYTKRAYDVADIQKAYVGFAWRSDESMESYVKNYLNIGASAMSTLYAKELGAQNIDPMHALMVLSLQAIESGMMTLPNLTPYPKPKPLMQRESGKIISAVATIIFLFMVPIIYDFIVGSITNTKNLVLQKEEARVTAKAQHYKKELQNKREELKALEAAIAKIEKIYQKKKGQVTQVYEKKFDYTFRSKQLALLTRLLKEYDLQSRWLTILDTQYMIELESKDSNKITAFIKALVAKYDKQISNVNIKDITYNKKEKLHRGVLKIEFMKGAK